MAFELRDLPWFSRIRMHRAGPSPTGCFTTFPPIATSCRRGWKTIRAFPGARRRGGTTSATWATAGRAHLWARRTASSSVCTRWTKRLTCRPARAVTNSSARWRTTPWRAQASWESTAGHRSADQLDMEVEAMAKRPRRVPVYHVGATRARRNVAERLSRYRVGSKEREEEEEYE